MRNHLNSAILMAVVLGAVLTRSVWAQEQPGATAPPPAGEAAAPAAPGPDIPPAATSAPTEAVPPAAVRPQPPSAPEPAPTVATPDAPETKVPEANDDAGTKVTAKPGKGFTVENADGSYSLTLKPRFQLRDTFTHDKKADVNEVTVKALRLTAQGNVVDKDLKYSVQLAFGSSEYEKDSPSPIYDAYLECVRNPNLEFRAGQFFVPFDRARTTKESALSFVDRQQVVKELTLDRDVGLMLSSKNLFDTDGVLGYALFLGGGDGKNRVGGVELGPLVVGRLSVRPFGSFDDDQEADLERSASPKLALGVAGGYNSNTLRQQSTFGLTNLTGKSFDYAHVAGDLVFKYEGFALLTEAVYRKANTDSVSGTVGATTTAPGTPTTEFSRSGWGYFAQAGYLVLDPLELVARWEQLFASNGTDPVLKKLADETGNQLGGGFNVYINGHALKVQADVFHAFRKDSAKAKDIVFVALDASF